MSKKPKTPKQNRPAQRSGVQVVLRVPKELKATMVKAATAARISANQAWIIRCTTGAMPQAKKEARS